MLKAKAAGRDVHGRAWYDCLRCHPRSRSRAHGPHLQEDTSTHRGANSARTEKDEPMFFNVILPLLLLAFALLLTFAPVIWRKELEKEDAQAAQQKSDRKWARRKRRWAFLGWD